MKNKKGAELSVNVIIVAVIALLVLVVLFAIFTGRMGIFTKGLGCEEISKNNHCVAACTGTQTEVTAFKCPTTAGSTSTLVCCKDATN